MTDLTPGALTEQYIKLRNKKKELSDAMEKAIKPYTDALQAIENHLLMQMNEQDVTSFKSEHGTAFKKTTMSVHTADKGALMRYVEEHGAFDLLTAAVSKDALQEHLEKNNDTPPPGVDVRYVTVVQVRKPS